MALVDRYALCAYLTECNDRDAFVFRPKSEIVDRVRVRQAKEEREQGTGEEIVLLSSKIPHSPASSASIPVSLTPAHLTPEPTAPTPTPGPTSPGAPTPAASAPPSTDSSSANAAPASSPHTPPTIPSSSLPTPPTPAMPALTATPDPLPSTSSPTSTAANLDMADPPEEPSAAVNADVDSVKQRTRKRARQGSELEDNRPTTRARKAEVEVGTRITRRTTAATQSTRGRGTVRGKGGVSRAKRR